MAASKNCFLVGSAATTLLNGIIDFIHNTGNDGESRGFHFLKVLDQLVDRFGKGDAASAVDVGL